tara:strand:+ start:169 stop:783 length:615 start_codon:yes stop_codon:yes gene_type:complete
MELIAETTKSKVFRIEDKVYKFRKHSKKKSFDNEMSIYNIINSLSLDNIIKFNNVDEDIMMIEMDYYPFNLESYFAGEYNVDTFDLDEKQKFKLIYIIVFIIGKLNMNDIVHGDFKAKNILFDRDFKPIITDFDLGNCGTLENDIHKMKILIYQILYHVEYKAKIYNNFDKLMEKNMKKDHPEIFRLLQKNDLCNLLLLLSKLY